MAEKIKIAMLTTYFNRNGVTSQVINYSTHLDKTKFNISIIAGEPFDEGYIRLCDLHSIHLLKLPVKQRNPLAYYQKIIFYLKSNHFDIVHVHGSSALISIELLIAMLAGVPVRIAHSHNTTCSHLLLHNVLKILLPKVSTCSLACGEQAGLWLYGAHPFQVIPNAFDTEKFVFNLNDRMAVRKQLGSDCGTVIGHVGTFCEPKNQGYLIRAFEKMAFQDDSAVLLLVGTGQDMEAAREHARQTFCSDRIVFWGETDNPSKLYSAMDIFALPSKFEGLPIVLLEAQISGLPCIVSDKVTTEVDFGNILWSSIEDDPGTWADAMQNLSAVPDERRKVYQKEHEHQIARYNIHNAVTILQNIYFDQLEQRRKSK